MGNWKSRCDEWKGIQLADLVWNVKTDCTIGLKTDSSPSLVQKIQRGRFDRLQEVRLCIMHVYIHLTV